MSWLKVLARRCAVGAVRFRYLLLMAWAVPWVFEANRQRADGLFSDWLTFEFGARTLIHYNSHYGTGALHLYANYPFIQIGPPALAVVAAVQWLPHNASSAWLAGLMALAGVWALRSAESTARALLPAERHRRVAVMTLCAGVLAIPFWSYEAGEWRHLDDVMAICFVLAATSLVARQRYWWLAGALVGVGIAAKPWALVLAPVLYGLSRSERPKAAIVAIASAAACWAPFIIGGPGTLNALGGYRLRVSTASTLHLLGVHSATAPVWVRPVQLVGGFILMAVLARRSHWVAIPFAALAFRVVTDPQTWIYYGMGPVVAAVLWDCLHERRWPAWTITTLVVAYAVPMHWQAAAGLARLLWTLAVFASCFTYGRRNGAVKPENEPDPVATPVLAPAH